MIVPMKKATIIVQDKDAQESLSVLRSLGIVHVENQQVPAGSQITQLKEDIHLITLALGILSEPDYLKQGAGKQVPPGDWRFVAKHVLELSKRLEQLKEYSRALTARIAEWERWGDFDPQEIERLKNKNIYLGLYQIPVKEINKMPSGLILKEAFTHAGLWHGAVVSRESVEIPFREIPLPKMGLEKMRTRLYEDRRMIEVITDDICRYLIHRQALINLKKDVEKELEFHEARHGMGKEANISYLTGFVPIDTVAKLEQAAKKEKWGLLVAEPAKDDAVPTLLRNPRWVELIKPVFNLLGILPGYRELDVSLLFLIFFSIFFGIIIGDAGIGIVYLILTAWLQKKKAALIKNKNIFLLLYLLSSCAIVWGALTGAFFGQGWLVKLGVKPLLPMLNNPFVMQGFCFFLGALHLSIAHSWRAVLKMPHLSALSDVGWICILWTAFFLARTLILGQAFVPFGLPLLFCGIALVILFTNPKKNIFKTVGSGLGTLALSLMNNFTDVVSYIRLFAVGLAGAAIAETTNAIAASLGTGGLAVVAGAAILVIGHTLNIILGPISVLVHGVRLNVFEFSGHASVTWSGSVYKPLQEEFS